MIKGWLYNNSNYLSLKAHAIKPWQTGTSSPLVRKYKNSSLLIFFLLFQTIIWYIYSYGFSARWMFDDAVNLAGLTQIEDWESSLDYIFSGISSSLGRPISMATFSLQADAWPGAPSTFRLVNTLLHLTNGMLIAFLIWLLTRRNPKLAEQALYLSVIISCLWLVQPLLASSVLSVVQRMTLLSAFFTLSGLISYVHGRDLLRSTPTRGFAWMTGGILGGLFFGVLSKENAILLPLLIIVLELTLLNAWPTLTNKKALNIWNYLFLALPLLLLLAYLTVNWTNQLEIYRFRPFTWQERLATESIILWEYLGQLLIPNASQLGLFHDDAPIHQPTDFYSLISIAGWGLLFAVAWVKRTKTPIASFALLWYLASHALESTALPLELYYEHRNYLAILGPIFAIVITLSTVDSPRKLNLIPLFALPIFTILLWSTTSLWGNPTQAAKMWYRAHPNSSRAVQFIAQQNILNGDIPTATNIVRMASKNNPRAGDLALQSIQMECGQMRSDEMQMLYEDVTSRTQTLFGSGAAAITVHKIATIVREGSCPGIDNDKLTVLIEKLLESESFSSSGVIRHHLHHALGVNFISKKDYATAIHHLDMGFNAYPSTDTAILIAAIFLSQGHPDIALKSLDESLKSAPRSHISKKRWRTKLNAFRNTITKQITISKE